MNIVCAGDCGVDRYLNRRLDRAGGITLNFAVNAKRLFHSTDRVFVITAVGRDPEADVVLGAIQQFALESVVIRGDGATPVQYIEEQESGERRFVGYVEGVLAGYRVGGRERGVIGDSDVLIAPVYTQVVGFFESVLDAPSRGLRTVDFSDLADFGIPLHNLTSSKQGIVHVMGPEQGLTKPGMTIVCGDSHTATHRAFGALAFGIEIGRAHV